MRLLRSFGPLQPVPGFLPRLQHLICFASGDSPVEASLAKIPLGLSLLVAEELRHSSAVVDILSDDFMVVYVFGEESVVEGSLVLGECLAFVE